MTQPWTVGVEQEFLLVDPESRLPVPPAGEVARHAGDSLDVQRELTPFQIEVATPVRGTAEELAEQVSLGRAHLAKAAHAAGCRLVAARDGVDGPAVDPGTGHPVRARDRAAELVPWWAAASDDASALSTVEEHLAWLGAHGSGAARRRRAFGASPDVRRLVDLILAETVDEAR